MAKTKGYKNGIYWETWHDDIYYTRFWVFIVDEKILPEKGAEIANLFNKLSGAECPPLDECSGACYSGYGKSPLNLDDGRRQQMAIVYTNTCRDVPTIVHEVIHAVNRVWIQHGVQWDAINDEHQAYYTDSIVAKILKIFEKYDEQKKGKEPSKPVRSSGKVRKTAKKGRKAGR